jgi:hypothetical protein
MESCCARSRWRGSTAHSVVGPEPPDPAAITSRRARARFVFPSRSRPAAGIPQDNGTRPMARPTARLDRRVVGLVKQDGRAGGPAPVLRYAYGGNIARPLRPRDWLAARATPTTRMLDVGRYYNASFEGCSRALGCERRTQERAQEENLDARTASTPRRQRLQHMRRIAADRHEECLRPIVLCPCQAMRKTCPQIHAFSTTSTAFVPPNANELESATRSGISPRAVPAT